MPSNTFTGMACITCVEQVDYMKPQNQKVKGLNILTEEVSEITEYMKSKQKAFDKVSDYSREIIRLSAQAITNLHNSMADAAKERLREAEKLLTSEELNDKRFEYYALQAQQEFAEAYIFYNIKTSGELPSRKSTMVSREAYLLGLMDCIGELKREILEELRNGNVEKAEFYFTTMRSIYDITRPIRFAEAVLQGFRKKQDVARIQIENAGTEILSFRKSRK